MVIRLIKEHRLPRPTVSLQAFVVRLKGNKFIAGGSTLLVGAGKLLLTAYRHLMMLKISIQNVILTLLTYL